MYCSCVSEVKHGFSIWFEECGQKERQNQSERVHSSIHHICIVHCVSILNDKLCINLNLLIFMLNVLILICLTNTALFMRMYALVFAHYSLFKETIGSMLPLDIQSNFTLIWICSSLCVFFLRDALAKLQHNINGSVRNKKSNLFLCLRFTWLFILKRI